MELKVAAEDEEIAAVAKQALQQIDVKNYITEIKDYSVDKIVKIGISFFKERLESAYVIV